MVLLFKCCFFYSAGVTFYNQLSEIFEKRRQEITKICKGEKERLQKIVEKAKQIKGTYQKVKSVNLYRHLKETHQEFLHGPEMYR